MKFEGNGREKNDVMWARKLHLGRAMTFLIAELFTSSHYASHETPTQTHCNGRSLPFFNLIIEKERMLRALCTRGIFLSPPSSVPPINHSLAPR